MIRQTTRRAMRLERTGPTAALSILVITLGALAATLWLASGNDMAAGTASGMELLWVLGWLGFGIVGALLISRRPRHVIGWLLLGIPAVTYTSLLSSEYAARGLVIDPGSLPFALLAGWIAKWSFTIALGLVLALLLVFPTGQVRDRRMRLVAGTLGVLLALMVVLLAIEPAPIRGDLGIDNPLAVRVLEREIAWATVAVGWTIALIALVVVIDVVRRWRHSAGIERRQFRWFAASTAAFPMLFVVGEVASHTVGAGWGWDPVVLAFFLGLNAIAAAIGVAITRYRLYEIDRIISRTVSYALITIALAGIYIAGVVGLGSVVRALTGAEGGDLLVATSTLAAAAAFGPLRRRVQAGVDRRFHRARYDAQRTVEAFGQRLRDEIDLIALTADLRSVVTSTVQPATVGLWRRGPEPSP
jgi:hypothetical protein